MKIPFWRRTIIPELWEECLSWAQQIGFLAKWIDKVEDKTDELDERVTELEEHGGSVEDVSDSKVSFVEMNNYDIQSGSTLRVLFGKLKHLITSLKDIAFSGSYNDLTDKPTIPVIPELATVATTGDYNDLTNKPVIPDVSGKQNIILASALTIGGQVETEVEGALEALNNVKADSSSLSPVATSGDYDDLSNKPNLATVATTGDYDDLSNKPNLATVATTGDYDDLINKPTIGSQEVRWVEKDEGYSPFPHAQLKKTEVGEFAGTKFIFGGINQIHLHAEDNNVTEDATITFTNNLSDFIVKAEHNLSYLYMFDNTVFDSINSEKNYLYVYSGDGREYLIYNPDNYSNIDVTWDNQNITKIQELKMKINSIVDDGSVPIINVGLVSLSFYLNGNYYEITEDNNEFGVRPWARFYDSVDDFELESGDIKITNFTAADVTNTQTFYGLETVIS